MRYSYVGMSAPMKAINNIFRRQISEFRRKYPGETPPLEPSGVFATSPTHTSAFTGDNDMMVHYTFFDVLKKSDIIFVFLGDKSLEGLPLTFSKYDIKGKIFCHASPAFTSNILDVNSYNTYTSFLLTSGADSDSKDAVYGPLLLEGYGRKFDEFTDALNALGVEHRVITAEEKRLYLTAMNFIKDFPLILKEIGKKLMKYSLADVPDVHEKILTIMSEYPALLTSYNALEAGDSNYINHQKDLVERLGIEPINRVFKSIVNIKEEF